MMRLISVFPHNGKDEHGTPAQYLSAQFQDEANPRLIVSLNAIPTFEIVEHWDALEARLRELAFKKLSRVENP